MNQGPFWLHRPQGGLAVCLCLAGLGLILAWGVSLNLLPASRHPALTITTRLPDAGPREVELLITRPVEEEMRGVIGLKRIYSVSKLGESQVTLDLINIADVSAAAQQVRGHLRRLRQSLPFDARAPVVSQYSPTDRPAVLLAISGGGSLAGAGKWAQRELAPRLRRLEGVAQAKVSGAPEPEILVECDPARLVAQGLTVGQVARAINLGSRNLPGGTMKSGGGERLGIVTAGMASGAEEVSRMPISGRPGGAVLKVGSVATVRGSHKDPREKTRLGGSPVVTCAVYQTDSADPQAVWQGVNRVITALSKGETTPPVEVVYSQARSLGMALERLGWVALIAAAAGALVIFLFLRNMVSTLVVLAAVPFSLLTAVLFLRLFGVALDLLALSGLALAMGILVDNAVVVIEAVHHHWRKGAAPAAGVGAGVGEVAAPILFSTLTTLAAFLPLLLVSDRVRLTMGGFFWGLSLSLVASLGAALVLIPLILLMAGKRSAVHPAGFKPPPVYLRVLEQTRKHPGGVAVFCAIFLAAGIWAGWGLSFHAGGGTGSRAFLVIVVTPPGTPQEATARQVDKVEALILKAPGVERVHSRVWANQGRVTVTLAPARERKREDFMAGLRARLPREQEAQFHVLPLGQGSGDASLTLNVFGPDLGVLSVYQRAIKEQLQVLPAVRDVILRMGSPTPILELRLDHRLLGRYGITAREAAKEVRAHLTGPVAVRLPGQDQEIEVRVRAKEETGKPVRALEGVRLAARGDRLIPLLELVRPRVVRAPSELFRQGLKRVVRMTLVLERSDPLGALARVEEALAGMKAPPGCYWEAGEEVERVLTTRREMLWGAVLALVLVYLVMVAATESWLKPFIVTLVAPLGLAGVILGLWLLDQPVNLPVYLGAVILAGLVVNSGIVMVDAMQTRRERGEFSQEAARAGALRRLRPVLMTTFSTLAAALPLLLDRGVGSGVWAPLALTLGLGVAFSALFSLVLIPLLYPLVDRLEGPGQSPQPSIQ